MRWVGFPLLALLPLLHITIGSTDLAADRRCIELHSLGWEARLDSTGRPVGCQEITKVEDCYPEWSNPNNGGKYECCPPGTTFASDAAVGVSACCGPYQKLSTDPISKTGACCDKGLHWTYDRVSSRGTCCQEGQDYDGIRCGARSGGNQLPSIITSSPSTPAPTVSSSVTSSPITPQVSSSSSIKSQTTTTDNPPSTSSVSQVTSQTSKSTSALSLSSSSSVTSPSILSTVTTSSSSRNPSSSSTSDSQTVVAAISSVYTASPGIQETRSSSSQASVSTLDPSFCAILCPSKSTVSPISVSSTASPSPVVGGLPAGQIPLKESAGSSCQIQTTQNNWFNGTCRGLQERAWTCPDWGTLHDIEVGKKVKLPVIGEEWPGYRPTDLKTFQFPVDTWMTITNYQTKALQGRARIYADDKLVGTMSALPSDDSGVCWDGGAGFDPCMISENTHSRGIFLIPAGTHNISLEHIEGSRMHYYAVRYDAACSDLTPCQGQQIVPFTLFTTIPNDPIFATSNDFSLPVDYADDVLLTLVDAGYAASQWTLSIDGVSQGALNRPTYLTKDQFMNDAVLSNIDPGHCFSWGAYWRVYVIPKGKHTVTMRVTGGMRATNAGIPWAYFDAAYKINKPCCAPV